LSVAVNGRSSGFIHTDLPESMFIGIELFDNTDGEEECDIKFEITKLA
jgi:hypothetical protein